MTRDQFIIVSSPISYRASAASAGDGDGFLFFFSLSLIESCCIRLEISVIVMTSERRQKVVIVGAGPVGSLTALYAAARGDDVEVYELRGGRSFVYLCWA